MSFVKPEGIMCLIEDLLSTTLAQVVPHLKFTPPPFPRMDYETAIEKVATCVVYSVTASCIIICSSNIFVNGYWFIITYSSHSNNNRDECC